MFAIETDNIIKKYKNGICALNGLSINVKYGEIYCLLGNNGAGKSSLINILTTYYTPSSGKVKILEKELYENNSWIRKQISCVSQKISVDEHLSLMENMLFQSRLYEINTNEAKKRISELIDIFSLSDFVNYPICSYSGGIKRRLDIAMNIISNPKILFLDEPTVGMDTISRKNIWKILLEIKHRYKTTIFLTTHYLEEAEQLSDTICIIKDGKKLIQDTPNNLQKFIHQNIIRIKFLTPEETIKNKKLIDEMNSTISSNINKNSINIIVKDKISDFINLNYWLLNNKIKFDSIEILKPSLEDIYLSLTS